MFRTNIILILTILFFANVSNAQVSLAQLEEQLAFYGDVMANTEKPYHREKAAAIFDSLFSVALTIPESVDYPFDSLKWISKLRPETGSFRLFSWLYNIGENKYKAYLQKDDGTVIQFMDNRPLLSSSELGNFSSKKWYGALYYGIEPFKMGKVDGYILLGYDGHDERTNKKIADILVIEANEVTLGAPIFIRKDENGKEEKSRIVIEYSDSSVGMMRFDRAQKILVYDNMVTVFAEGPNMGGVPVPHGSFSAYELKGGKWIFKENVFGDFKEKVPTSSPASKGANKDILGRPKNG